MGLIVKISGVFCYICDNKKQKCIKLDDDGPRYENNVIYICEDCLKEGLELLNE